MRMDPSDRAFDALHRMLNPRGVAVIGASSRANSIGYWFVESLLKGGFRGGIFPVNPRGGKILGLRVREDLKALSGLVDLGILAIPSEAALLALKDCQGLGMAGVVVTAGGFAEVGEEGKRAQDMLVQAARGHGLRVVGPNSMGLINTFISLNATFSREMGGSPPGGISVISQSGSMCETVYFRCRERGLGLSILISSGNEADLDLCDYLHYALGHPATSVIALYVEQIKRPSRFMGLLGRDPLHKPVVLFRTGRTARGKLAASSHTGAIAGSDLVMRGVLAQLGVVEARSYQEFVDWTVALSAGRYPEGKGLAIITGPGAPGVAATDAALEAGLEMFDFGRKTSERLEKILPRIASARNPVDLTGMAATDPEVVSCALRIALDEESVHGVILIFGALSPRQGIESIAQIVRGQGKPVLAVMVGSITENQQTKGIVEELGRNGIPCFFTPEDAVKAFGVLAMVGRRLAPRPTPS
ncbi:MAG: acetate--CoA ligase family protein [Thermodesulfobacteriota bacterium]